MRCCGIAAQHERDRKEEEMDRKSPPGGRLATHAAPAPTSLGRVSAVPQQAMDSRLPMQTQPLSARPIPQIQDPVNNPLPQTQQTRDSCSPPRHGGSPRGVVAHNPSGNQLWRSSTLFSQASPGLRSESSSAPQSLASSMQQIRKSPPRQRGPTGLHSDISSPPQPLASPVRYPQESLQMDPRKDSTPTESQKSKSSAAKVVAEGCKSNGHLLKEYIQCSASNCPCKTGCGSTECRICANVARRTQKSHPLESKSSTRRGKPLGRRIYRSIGTQAPPDGDKFDTLSDIPIQSSGSGDSHGRRGESQSDKGKARDETQVDQGKVHLDIRDAEKDMVRAMKAAEIAKRKSGEKSK
jgi:hypothetical protein